MAVSKRNDQSGSWFDIKINQRRWRGPCAAYIAAERPIGKGTEVFSSDVRADKLVHRFRNCLVRNAMSTMTARKANRVNGPLILTTVRIRSLTAPSRPL
jgi:hypothetical protein